MAHAFTEKGNGHEAKPQGDPSHCLSRLMQLTSHNCNIRVGSDLARKSYDLSPIVRQHAPE